jgi:glutathione S-transferase
MMGSPFEIAREIRVEASRERVFALLTDIELLKTWMPMDSFDPLVGGRYVYAIGEWVATGTVLECVHPSRLVYSWDWVNSPMGATRVEFDLIVDGDATVVHLRHSGFPIADVIDSHARGWDYVVPRLALVAAGSDPGPADVLRAVFGGET